VLHAAAAATSVADSAGHQQDYDDDEEDRKDGITSEGSVQLARAVYGRGPTCAKSYYQDDLVVCVLRGGFSRVEETLLEGGRGPAVIQQRMEFQEVMRERFTG
jgi:uncharacterized protein YbcI